MAKLILGCGYLGSRVARRWREAGHEVFVVTRDQGRAAEFLSQGYRPIVADVTRARTMQDLPAAETVVYAVGHDRRSGGSPFDFHVHGLQNVLAALAPGTGRIIYVSSTGVYGQIEGELVDEDSPCRPDREGGKAALAAERLLAEHAWGQRAIVLRLAGLYGPGRIPNAEALRRGDPLAVPHQGYLNLIHVDDAATVVLAAADRAQPPRTYVVSDGHPVERRAYYDELGRLLDLPRIRFAEPAPESHVLARASTSKRLVNVRMLNELGVSLAYPTYRQGLAAILSAGP